MKIMIAMLCCLASAQPADARMQARPPGAISCIDPHALGGSRAEGDDTLIVQVGTKTYRNHLASACPGLARLNDFATLTTEPWGGGLCRGDTVRVSGPDGSLALGIASAPRCRLGWFEPVSQRP